MSKKKISEISAVWQQWPQTKPGTYFPRQSDRSIYYQGQIVIVDNKVTYLFLPPNLISSPASYNNEVSFSYSFSSRGGAE